tara:strand:- start:9314 stop:9856 length:543 start_codon:yes stop_codon:yes gene_type:complete
MKTDQDLIFEAYAKTLNEGVYKARDVTITDYDIEDIARDGVGGGYQMVPIEFKDENGTTMTGIVDYLYVDYDQVDGSGEIHDAKVGTLEEDDNDEYAPEEAPADDQALDIAPEEGDNVADDYPDHEEILSNIREIVDENIGYDEGRQHSRETLNDIIDDLVQYRNGLPSTDDYMKGGKYN